MLSKHKPGCPIFERESAFLSSYERTTFKSGHEILNEEGKGDGVISDQMRKHQKDVDIERIEVNRPDIARAGVNVLCNPEKEKANETSTHRNIANPNFGKMGIKKNNAEDSKHQEVEKEKVHLNTEDHRCRKEKENAVKKSFRNEVDKPEEVKSNAETQNFIADKKTDSQEKKRHTSEGDFFPAIVKSATYIRTDDELEKKGSCKSSVGAKNKKLNDEKARFVDADSKMKTGKEKRTADSASIFETNHQKKAKYDGEGERHFGVNHQKISNFDAEENKRNADEAENRERARLYMEERNRMEEEANRQEKASLDAEEKKRIADEAKRR